MFRTILLVGLFGIFFGSLYAQKTGANPQSILLKSSEVVSFSHPSKIKRSKVTIPENGWLEYQIDVSLAGRYTLDLEVKGKNAMVWVEDYVHNKDQRTYNITGDLTLTSSPKNKCQQLLVFGTPLNTGKHQIRIHAKGGEVEFYNILFTCAIPHLNTPEVLTQKMDGEEWKLVWNDEFEYTGLPDSNKWNYNVGNWGWGNNEEQFYTHKQLQNAEVNDGVLTIRAIRDVDSAWTSARLTTAGKTSFTYGKIEFRAKVPSGRGTWSAGWLLGDAYRDELSWPYCGEIDVLECVGFEIDDSSGNGLNHASCHTRAYYFKQNNHISSVLEVEDLANSFHTFTVEWYPEVIYMSVDGQQYYVYDRNQNELEWPFHNPQNIILNLAIGGGWGGAKGVDPNINQYELLIDYVRVYSLE